MRTDGWAGSYRVQWVAMQRAERGSWLANGKRGYGDKEGRTKYVEIGCRYQTYLQPFDAFPLPTLFILTIHQRVL